MAAKLSDNQINKLLNSPSYSVLNTQTEYTHLQHRHNFAVWCAARSVQRNFAKTPYLIEAIKISNLKKFVKENENATITAGEFDVWHETWCDSILSAWTIDEIKGRSYGRAAKLIAVYLKAMVVIKNSDSDLAKAAHPPIDRILLQSISKDKSIDILYRKNWREINWTQLCKSEYLKLIDQLRRVIGSKPFWHLERYWSL